MAKIRFVTTGVTGNITFASFGLFDTITSDNATCLSIVGTDTSCGLGYPQVETDTGPSFMWGNSSQICVNNVPIDPKMIKKWERENRRYLRMWRKSRRRRQKSEGRAEELFRSIVGEKKFRQYKFRGYHEVIGVSGKRYRLRPGQRTEVMKGARNKVLERLCIIHSTSFGLPKMDTMITILMMIVSGREDELLKIAGRFAA